MTCFIIINLSDSSVSRSVHDTNSISGPKLSSIIKPAGKDHGLTVLYRSTRGMISAANALHRDTWDSVLCEGVPVSMRELVLLVADQLDMNADLRNAHKLLLCSWSLGWHVKDTSSEGVTRHYWGGGVTPRTTSNYLRGDWIEIKGSDTRFGVPTSRLARVICGVQIDKVTRRIRDALPDMIWETVRNKRTGVVTFQKTYLLVRFAVGHRHSGRNRGPNLRPLCPGLLQETHCLWSWAQRRPGYKRGCFQGRSWDRNKRFFGNTTESQDMRKDLEERAWYDLVSCDQVIGYANVQPDPDRDHSFLQSVMWC